MTTIRIVEGTRVVAQIRIDTVADGATVEVDSGNTVVGPPAPPSPQASGTRTWPAALAWTVLGVAGLLTEKLVKPSFWSPWNHTRWTVFLSDALAGLLLLHLAAGALFLVLKVIGRRLRFTDALRTLALLAWLLPALGVASLVAYYPLSPSAYNWFAGLLGAAAASFGVAAAASLNREPRSLTFTATWAAISLAAIIGLASITAMSAVERGEPIIDLELRAPVGGYAGTAVSLDDYLAAVRSAAQTNERPQVAP
jgi:hypothetical protein